MEYKELFEKESAARIAADDAVRAHAEENIKHLKEVQRLEIKRQLGSLQEWVVMHEAARPIVEGRKAIFSTMVTQDPTLNFRLIKELSQIEEFLVSRAAQMELIRKQISELEAALAKL